MSCIVALAMTFAFKRKAEVDELQAIVASCVTLAFKRKHACFTLAAHAVIG